MSAAPAKRRYLFWTYRLALANIDRPLHDMLNARVGRCEGNLQITGDLRLLCADISFADDGIGSVDGTLAANVDGPSATTVHDDLRESRVSVKVR